MNLGETVLIKFKDEVVDEVEAIAYDDEWEVVGELGFSEKTFDLLRIVKVTFLTNAPHLANLTSTSGNLDVLKMNLRILTEIDNRAKVIVEPCFKL
jgi:hypothetical protein